MIRPSYSLAVLALAASAATAAPPTPVVTGLKNPESVAVASDGRVFVTVLGEIGTDGDGAVMLLKDGKAEPFATGFDDPRGIVAFQQWLFVADKTRVRRIDLKTGKADVYADEAAFPVKPTVLNDVTADEQGTLYVSDSGDRQTGSGGAIFRVRGRQKQKATVTLVADGKLPFVKRPNGLVLDSQMHLLVLDTATGELNRLRLSDSTVEKVADGFAGGDGLCFDRFGRLFVSSWAEGKVWVIPRPGVKPILLAQGLQSAADLTIDAANKNLLVPDMKAGTVVAIPAQPPGWEVDETPLPVATEVAFAGMTWTGWDYGEDSGKLNPLRPLVLTHAGDGSHRTFVATQHGVVHVIPDEPNPKQTKVFLDLQSKVLYKDNENEQGLLGLAFHPKYKATGEFFVFYTDKSKKFENVLSRFRASKDDPDRADPASEEELLRIKHKYWNHDGGTLCFGPDGYLYVVLGDGGAGGDPDDHGQKPDALLGKILRLDVSKKGDGTPYAIPADNPFVGAKGSRPEVYALGVRNPWRLAFDHKTGQGWFADVGQNLWEEINLLEKGGNYGWRRREGLHPFGGDGTGPRTEFIEPVWEYHHEVGKSITGGHVYRGKAVPELDGLYLYADYVTSKVWGLRYDAAQKRVTANRPIRDNGTAIMSFGEDERGEVYLLTFSATGKGITRLVRDSGSK